MAKKIIEYDLLLSCPSDVKEELEIVEDVIKDFNRTLGSANGCRINVKHWSTNAYPSLGDSAQNKINKQVINECDMAIAILWTRFGTPTQEYGSGTEEEIEIFVRKNKQVFLYFSDREIAPSKVDISQYDKVKKYREKIEKEQKGMHWSYDSKERFRKMLSNHISMHFISIIEDMEDPHKVESNLMFKGVDESYLFDSIKLKKRNLLNSQFMNEKKEIIFKGIDEIKNINIKENEDSTISTPIFNMFSKEKVIIEENSIDIVDIFLESHNIDIDKSRFYFLGNLTRIRNPIGGGIYGNEPTFSYQGTVEEKRKYELLKDIILRIEKYINFLDYFKKINELYYFEMALINIGKTYDEDVDIKLFIRKGLLVKPEELPLPKNIILETIKESVDFFYKSEATHNLYEYPNYYHEPPIFSRGFIMQTEKEKIKEMMREYNSKLNKLFCYTFFEDEEYDIISYNQSYIKQNTNSLLPSLIYVKDKPLGIKYEIRSKHFPDVMAGTLKVEF